MTEFELKLEVPAGRLEAVRAELEEAGARPMVLRATYVDTPGRALAAAGVALRMRLEGARWVQAAKGPGERAVERLEHEVVVDGTPESAPPVDPSRHAGTALGARIGAALAGAGADARLVPVLETDIRRLAVQLDVDGGRVEIALDEGRILAGDRAHAVAELEVERKSGAGGAAVAAARDWAARHGLWLSTVSKAQRGQLLAAGLPCAPPAGATPLVYGRGATAGEVVAAVLHACLQQVLDNASAVAGGGAGDDHVHQLRVGLRRLRTALRELQVLAPLDTACEPALVAAFRDLGAGRDRSHVAGLLAPRIEAAGGPVLPAGLLQGPGAPAPAEVVRAPGFQDALCSVLATALEAQGVTGKPRPRLARPLQALWRQVLRDGRRFTALDVQQQHRVRKRLKRLRYLGEFAAPLWPARRVERFLGALKPVQDRLGAYNDELVGLALWHEAAARDARALFGAGWLQARGQAQARACRKALRQLADVSPFWD